VAGEREALEAEVQEMQEQRQLLEFEQVEIEALAAEVREKRRSPPPGLRVEHLQGYLAHKKQLPPRTPQ
jgi:hypothetical protein